MIIDLKLNDNLIPKGHFVRYQLPNGDKVIKKFTKTDVDLCHYHVSKTNFHDFSGYLSVFLGQIWSGPNSWSKSRSGSRSCLSFF